MALTYQRWTPLSIGKTARDETNEKKSGSPSKIDRTARKFLFQCEIQSKYAVNFVSLQWHEFGQAQPLPLINLNLWPDAPAFVLHERTDFSSLRPIADYHGTHPGTSSALQSSQASLMRILRIEAALNRSRLTWAAED